MTVPRLCDVRTLAACLGTDQSRQLFELARYRRHEIVQRDHPWIDMLGLEAYMR